MESAGLSEYRKMNALLDYDVLIIGAGLSGIYSLYRIRELGLLVKVLETGGDVGGTWYWNRYPGARFDSESYTYNFSFSEDVLNEWNWSEHFAGAPETRRYCDFLCAKFDLKRDMQFNTRVKSAYYQEDDQSWLLTDEEGHQYSSRFLITATGLLDNHTLPNIPGVESFKGQAFHTARWPEQSPDLKAKRVAIIGTGATAIQIIPEITKDVGHLTVFRRRANWSAPLHNSKISPDEMKDLRHRYPEIFEMCWNSPLSFLHQANTDSFYKTTPEQRLELWEKLYATPGFGKWLSNYPEVTIDKHANAVYCEFMANKIRQRVKDPATAEKLIPKDHGFGTRRVPLETFYFEAYNQPHVKLVDLKENPIESITEKGIKTRDEDFQFDIIIYATGFDAVTGSYTSIDFQGLGGVKLAEYWEQSIQTFMGIFIEGFPNLTMIAGPHQMLGNIPRSIEFVAEWISDLIKYCRDNHITCFQTPHNKVVEWTEHVHSCGQGVLLNEVDSWMTGVNKNLAHAQKRRIAVYIGPAAWFRERANNVANSKYEDLELSSIPARSRM